MTSVCSDKNARSDWQILGHYTPVCPRADYGPAKSKQKAIG